MYLLFQKHVLSVYQRDSIRDIYCDISYSITLEFSFLVRKKCMPPRLLSRLENRHMEESLGTGRQQSACMKEALGSTPSNTPSSVWS